MTRISTTCLAILATAGLTSLGCQAPAPIDPPGATVATSPQDVIAARRALMRAIEDQMPLIDGYTVDGEGDLGTLASSAQTIAAMLLAFPHLFPPTTNLYDPAAELPVTLALPTLWEDFPAFSAMTAAAATTAAAMADATGPEEMREAALGVRASCDSCHGQYMRPYVRGTVSEEDKDFDFDSIFQKE